MLNNEQKKFCSSGCAAKYNNTHRKVTIETRRKISEALQKRNPKFDGIIKPITVRNQIKSNKVIKYCCYCGKELKENQIKYCSFECQKLDKRKHYIER